MVSEKKSLIKDDINENIPSSNNTPDTEFKIPVEGTLGLLALGAVGIKAWRNARKKAKEGDK